MPVIDSNVTINAPLDLVWQLAQDVEKLPEFMPDLEYVKVLEREQRSQDTVRVVTDWCGWIRKFNRKVDWVEEDIWTLEDHTCHFWQLRGDFRDYRGEWKFKDEAGGTSATLHIEYRFEIPLIGAIIQKVVKNLLQQNSDGMLSALKTEAERRATQPHK